MNAVLFILLAYFALMLGVAWYFSRKESLEEYFLNRRRTSLWLMTFSTVATVVGAGATVAIVSEVYHSGISYGLALPTSFIIGMVIMGIVAYRIRAFGEGKDIYTIVDFYDKRYGVRNKHLVAVLVVLMTVIWIAIQTIAIASLAQVLVGIPYTVAIIVSAGITIIYTSIGGLKIDIITDFIQFWIILLVFIIMTVYGYLHVGSLSGLFSGLPPGHLDPFAFGGVSWFVGMIVFSGFIYLANPSHWQRILSAENPKVARKSFFLSIPFMVIISATVLFFGFLAAYTLTGVPQDTAFYALTTTLMPAGLAGLGFAAILAVIMSSVDSLLIGGSTIIYRYFFRTGQIARKKEIWYARGITVVFGIIGCFIAFIVPSIVMLSLVGGYAALLFVPSFLAGLYAKKTSGAASFYSILIPFILLVALTPLIGKNVFLVTTPLSVAIVVFYDKVFRSANETAML